MLVSGFGIQSRVLYLVSSNRHGEDGYTKSDISVNSEQETWREILREPAQVRPA